MYKVDIKNTEGKTTHQAIFATIVEANQWIQDVGPSGAWGEFTSQIVDITNEIKKQKLIEYGLKAQSFGRQILAEVLAINELKLEAGSLNESQFALILQSEDLKIIERLLVNGSLNTAKNRIDLLDTTFFSAEEKALIIEKITAFLSNENKLD